MRRSFGTAADGSAAALSSSINRRSPLRFTFRIFIAETIEEVRQASRDALRSHPAAGTAAGGRRICRLSANSVSHRSPRKHTASISARIAKCCVDKLERRAVATSHESREAPPNRLDAGNCPFTMTGCSIQRQLDLTGLCDVSENDHNLECVAQSLGMYNVSNFPIDGDSILRFQEVEECGGTRTRTSSVAKGSLRNRLIVLPLRDSPWNRNVIHARHGYDRAHPAPVRGPVAAS